MIKSSLLNLNETIMCLQLELTVTLHQTDQVDGPLVEGGGLQDLLHGDRLQFVRVQLLALVRYAVVHDHRQWADTGLLIVSPSFLKEET